MTSDRFNLGNLFNIYKQAEEETKAVIFESHIGKGRFLFMIFFSEEDSSKDKFFLYLRNTNELISSILYGNHSKGDFYIYPSKIIQDKLVKELQLKEGTGTFNFNTFMQQFNESIPQSILAAERMRLMKNHKNVISQTDAIDEAEKTHLLSIKRLSVGTPRDKTLRKLYLYTENNPRDIESLISILKKANYTTMWGKKKPEKNVNVQSWINKLS